MRTNNSDGTENTTSAPLDESETSEEEVLPTIITLIMFANTIRLSTNKIKRSKNKLIPPGIHIVFHRFFHSFQMDILIVSQDFWGYFRKLFWRKQQQNKPIRIELVDVDWQTQKENRYKSFDL